MAPKWWVASTRDFQAFMSPNWTRKRRCHFLFGRSSWKERNHHQSLFFLFLLLFSPWDTFKLWRDCNSFANPFLWSKLDAIRYENDDVNFLFSFTHIVANRWIDAFSVARMILRKSVVSFRLWHAKSIELVDVMSCDIFFDEMKCLFL